MRRRVRGTDERPRLSVFRSDRHIYAQVVTDESRKTLLAVSTLTAELRAQLGEDGRRRRREAGRAAGRAPVPGEGHHPVVFDRNGFLYHGRVRAVAEGAREGGLQF